MYQEELVLTVRKNPGIKEVHFTASGEHFFQVYSHSMGVFGQFVDGVPVIKSKISKSVYREDILRDGEVDESKPEVKEKPIDKVKRK